MDEIKKDTYMRLIESAGKLFAKKGFKETTVREICEHADANIASVNYYFRDKKKLFFEVLKYVIEKSEEKFPLDRTYDEFDTPEEKLHEFVKDTVMRRFSPELPQWFGRLLTREALMEIPDIKQLMMNQHRRIGTFFKPFMAEMLNADADSMIVRLCETSIIGNMRFLTGPLFIEHHPLHNKEIEGDLVDKLIDFLTDYSLSSIEGIRDKLQQEGSEKYEF